MFGLLPGHEYTTVTVPLRSGDLLILYTDGLVERRGEDIGQGIDGLRRVLVSCEGLGAQEAVDRIVAEFTPEDNEDDTCLVAVRLD
ncbi:SpoIIE family protein phosphatase [Streptomyces avidinii]|uniref:SpoIIE family protein phosphatase n=1 Tax=Streptomyces avidinii TaxID=1895 RepID=UPI0037BB0603